MTGDEAYGDNTVLRRRCAGRGVNHVFAVSCDHPLVLGGAKTRADAAFAAVPQTAWQRHSCGEGAVGRRWYDWAWIQVGEHEWMLARRSISDPTDLACYRCAANRPVGLPQLVRVAGSRWSVEECFQATKNEVGLDHYQVRKHTAWHRHVTLATASYLAFLAAAPPPDPDIDHSGGEDDDLATQGPCRQERTGPDDVNGHEPGELIPLTVNEIRRLHTHLHRPRHPPGHRIRWSHWRRHQARARRCHQRQRRLMPEY